MQRVVRRNRPHDFELPSVQSFHVGAGCVGWNRGPSCADRDCLCRRCQAKLYGHQFSIGRRNIRGLWSKSTGENMCVVRRRVESTKYSQPVGRGSLDHHRGRAVSVEQLNLSARDRG